MFSLLTSNWTNFEVRFTISVVVMHDIPLYSRNFFKSNAGGGQIYRIKRKIVITTKNCLCYKEVLNVEIGLGVWAFVVYLAVVIIWNTVIKRSITEAMLLGYLVVVAFGGIDNIYCLFSHYLWSVKWRK